MAQNNTPIATGIGTGAAQILNKPVVGDGLQKVADRVTKLQDDNADEKRRKKALAEEAKGAANLTADYEGLTPGQSVVFENIYNKKNSELDSWLENNPNASASDIKRQVAGMQQELNGFYDQQKNSADLIKQVDPKDLIMNPQNYRNGSLALEAQNNPNFFRDENGNLPDNIKDANEATFNAYSQTRKRTNYGTALEDWLGKNKTMLTADMFTEEVDKEKLGNMNIQNIVEKMKPEALRAIGTKLLTEGSMNFGPGDQGMVTDVLETIPETGVGGITREEQIEVYKQRARDERNDPNYEPTDIDVALEAMLDRNKMLGLVKKTKQQGADARPLRDGDNKPTGEIRTSEKTFVDSASGETKGGTFTSIETISSVPRSTTFDVVNPKDGSIQTVTEDLRDMGILTNPDGSREIVKKRKDGRTVILPFDDAEEAVLESALSESAGDLRSWKALQTELGTIEEGAKTEINNELIEQQVSKAIDGIGESWWTSNSLKNAVTEINSLLGEGVASVKGSKLMLGGVGYDVVNSSLVGGNTANAKEVEKLKVAMKRYIYQHADDHPELINKGKTKYKLTPEQQKRAQNLINGAQ